MNHLVARNKQLSGFTLESASGNLPLSNCLGMLFKDPQIGWFEAANQPTEPSLSTTR